MKLVSLFLCAASGMSFAKPVHLPEVPHYDLEMTGPEYRAILEEKMNDQDFVTEADPLKDILKNGKRNLDWIDAINATRPDDQKIQLTTPESTVGIPIDAPRKSNREIIINDFATLKNELPREFLDVIFSSDDLPSTTSLDNDTFLIYARRLNRSYESASRWLLQEPALSAYEARSVIDIRGYYFLSREQDLAQKLNTWSQLDAATQKQYSEWLVGQCRNASISVASCKTKLARAVQTNAVKAFYDQYLNDAKEMYNSFFDLQNPRSEAVWNAQNPNLFTLPFRDPGRADVKDWFVVNVEDEWKWNDWALKIDMRPSGNNLAHIEFEAGATPHVNDLGGDTITMDGNRNLQEYSVRWTIRHEFGHVLGLPDCYAEFYDATEKVMINYQLDLTNLMCSRRGHLKQEHYDQLKKAYFRN